VNFAEFSKKSIELIFFNAKWKISDKNCFWEILIFFRFLIRIFGARIFVFSSSTICFCFNGLLYLHLTAGNWLFLNCWFLCHLISTLSFLKYILANSKINNDCSTFIIHLIQRSNSFHTHILLAELHKCESSTTILHTMLRHWYACYLSKGLAQFS
jgi:hypothetical protein